jgi:hypothetical protein
MRTYGGGTPDIINLGIRSAGLSVWRPGRFTSSAHHIGEKVGPKASLDAVDKKEMSQHCQESKPYYDLGCVFFGCWVRRR